MMKRIANFVGVKMSRIMDLLESVDYNKGLSSRCLFISNVQNTWV